MADRGDLVDWVLDAVRRCGGEATVIQVARDIWANHANELHASGDLFYTWQYDMRWAAQKLRDAGQLRKAAEQPRGVWALR
jgi:hypothetical protein